LLDIYSTFPLSTGATPDLFTRDMRIVADWSEAAGVQGLLVFTNNGTIDPWNAAQFLIERTENLVPLVAAQPAYMHPFTAARLVSTLSSMYGRRIDLNLVTGGYKPLHNSLGCRLDHDERYDRLIEYGEIMASLLGSDEPTTHLGAHYEMTDTVLVPPLPHNLLPRTFVAGSSTAAANAAQALGALRLTYPRALHAYAGDTSAFVHTGIRLGIIARDTNAEAWRVAQQRFPTDSLGEKVNEAAARVLDAQWHNKLWQDAQRIRELDDVYWLYPFRATQEYCPYLVGNHAEVAEVLAQYLLMGATTLILATPRHEDDLFHAFMAIRQAENLTAVR
jgi:alkanesulfonate monooxygenase